MVDNGGETGGGGDAVARYLHHAMMLGNYEASILAAASTIPEFWGVAIQE